MYKCFVTVAYTYKVVEESGVEPEPRDLLS